MLRLRSHAKLNWHLEVLGRRSDGYHSLRTLFQTLDLADDVTLESIANGIELRVRTQSGARFDPPVADSGNLAWRAAELYLERFARPGAGGVRIGLLKRIPVGGGLGGGSSNAATVLAGLARLEGRDPGAAALREAAAELGADVPYFFVGGVALGLERGDAIGALDDRRLADVPLYLAVPPFAVSTREVFSRLEPLPRRTPGPALERAFAGELPARMTGLEGWNDLEAPCFELFPRLRALYNQLSDSGATWVRLSGSGGTICAAFADARAAERVGRSLPDDVSWLPSRTMNRSDWRSSAGW